MHVCCLLARIYIFIVYLPVFVYMHMSCLCVLCCLVCVVCVHDSQRQILSVCRVIAIMQVSMYVLAGVRVCLSRYIGLFHHAQGISSYGTLEVHMG